MRVDAEPDTTDITVALLDRPEAVPPTFPIWLRARIAGFDTADCAAALRTGAFRKP